ncbi:MAG: peptidyl-prolyl cis-trans isomerase, partial [Candidatus Eisenbacteria bacterium]|nr:peptidyl-prolyl cis-trans isomerase [Candidatus Eisenbacteria bacterium]
ALWLIALVPALLAGCTAVEDKPAIRLTDNEGIVAPRVVTVGYINERLERVPVDMIPDMPGDEGKRAFMDEIIRKELLVIYGTRLGALEDERLGPALDYFRDSKAEEMLREELITGPAQVTPEEVADYYEVRDDLFQLQEIQVPSEEEAREAHRRVTEGGEDFGRVASEVSRVSSAQDEGRKAVATWTELHPLIRVAIRSHNTGDIIEPFAIGDTWYVLKVLSRKDPAAHPALDDSNEQAMSAEARAFKRNILEYEVFKEWRDSSNLTFNDEAVDLCGTRIDEEVRRLIPDTEAVTPEDRMDRARMSIIPQFTDEEAQMVLCTYNIFGAEHVVTLGDFAGMCTEVPGIETPKTGDRIQIETFMKRIIQRESIDAKVEERGFLDSAEMEEYLEQRTEEFIIDITYDQEVVKKVEEPTGQEIRDYYRSHLDDFIEPAGVDVQQLIVSTEAVANRILQRINSGEATFTEMVREHSIDDWSKAKDGIITEYRQGEKRLDYLQGVVFDLAVGEIGGPIRAPGGYALVKVVTQYPERQMTFDEVGGVVKQSIINMKREELLMKLLEDARNTVTIDYIDENFKYIKDPAEILQQKLAES